MRKELNQQLQRVNEKWTKLSEREQLLIVCSISVLVIFGLAQMLITTLDAFDGQARQIALAEDDIRTLPTVLERYAKLKSRRDAIESQYKQVEIREGALSYIENLVKTKLSLPAGQFSIKDPPARPFGGQFEQLPFIIKLSTTDIKALVDFLKEVVEGAKPLILSRLELQHRAGSDKLEVEMDISSIRIKRGA